MHSSVLSCFVFSGVWVCAYTHVHTQILESRMMQKGCPAWGMCGRFLNILVIISLANADFEKNNRFSNKFSTQKPEWSLQNSSFKSDVTTSSKPMIFPVLLLFCKGSITQPGSLYINLNVTLNFLLSLSSQNLLSISSISLISIPAAFTHT